MDQDSQLNLFIGLFAMYVVLELLGANYSEEVRSFFIFPLDESSYSAYICK